MHLAQQRRAGYRGCREFDPLAASGQEPPVAHGIDLGNRSSLRIATARR
jgi:hypothetical protein